MEGEQGKVISQVMRLCRLQLVNMFELNELRYTKDKVKKARFMCVAVVWIILIFMLVGYIGSYSYGMIFLGMADIVPMYLYAIASLIIMIFSFFKAGSILFAMKGYDMLASLPVSKAAVVISRFGCMYVTNMLLGLLIMLPGLVVYGYMIRPTVLFYVIFMLGTLFLPLFPLTISSIIGAGITAISARVKRKSLVDTLLMVILVIGIVMFSVFCSDKEEMLTEDFLKDMAKVLSAQIGAIYPPALWFSNALLGNVKALSLVLAIQIVVFMAFVMILQRYFQSICAAINAVTAKNDYQMTSLRVNGQVVALWKRELRRYFSSSVYVTNTIIGYVLAAMLSIAICFVGMEQFEVMFKASDIEPIIAKYTTCIPYILACLMSMTSTTSCSISLEGNTFWQIQTLPVKVKQIYDSKILMNLTVAVPFYIISVIFLRMSAKLSILEFLWLLIIPAVYLVFECVLGISVNLAFPVFNWESEVSVVKQSATTFITMLVGMVSSIVPLIIMLFLEEQFANFMNIIVVLIILAITSVLYLGNNRKDLKVSR